MYYKGGLMSFCYKNMGLCLVDVESLLTFASSDINIIKST